METAGEVVAEAAREATAEVVAEIRQVEAAHTDAVIAAANEQIQRAEQNAEEIARAALETEQGRQIQDLRNEVTQCQQSLNLLRETVEMTNTKLSELAANQAPQVTIIEAAPALAPTESLSPIQQSLDHAIEVTETIAPAAMPPAPVANTPAAPEQPQPVVKRRTWM